MTNNGITTDLMSSLSIQEKQKTQPKTNELGRDAFLELMITQMENQNPLDPQTNSEFVAQLAQFSSVEGLDKLNASMNKMASSFETSLQSTQALQASSMVGREVKVNTNRGQLTDDGVVSGTIQMPFSTGHLSLNIYDVNGQLVSTDVLGVAGKGARDFSWDGTDADGERMAPGLYYVEAIAKDSEGKPVAVNTTMRANVDSVSVAANGTITLNVAGVGPVSISSLEEIL
jgi:flagellar basal-body rod modification protein FlgD